MKKTGAWLAVHALEQLGVRWTFGIPGVHTTELYDELNNSTRITPLLVTHEGCASFMADAISRVTGKPLGALALVPAAGLTHAASGIGEARLAGIPMLILSGGIRTDLDKRYQLHEIDQLKIAQTLTKAAFRIERHQDIIPTLHEAWRVATTGEPGPVFIEIPVNLQLFPGTIEEIPAWNPPAAEFPPIESSSLEQAASLLHEASHPALYVGWGARHAVAESIALAEMLGMPVATTLQGISAFPADHPLHAGFGFSRSATPPARNAFQGCDCLLAVGARFGEIATGSFGVNVPKNLIHIDINPAVFDANYPARVKIHADARQALQALNTKLNAAPSPDATGIRPNRSRRIQETLAKDKHAWMSEWLAHNSHGRVNPARFFKELRQQTPDDAITIVDDGNHTYLAAELFPVHRGGLFLSPTDFNAMGYAVPAAMGAQIAAPEREVFAIVGDGAFLMTALELGNAAARKQGIVIYIFRDGELAQIAQAQEITYRRKPCTRLEAVNLEGIAMATGAAYLAIPDNESIADIISRAKQTAAKGQPVIVDIAIDYTKRTAFTNGLLKTNFRRLSPAQSLRMAGRAIVRRITG